MEKYGSSYSFDVLEPTQLTNETLTRLYEIERDCIGFFYNEVKVCDSCGTIYNKEEVHGHTKDFKEKTVCQLEKENGASFQTPCCNTTSTDYRSKQQTENIRERILMGVNNTLDGCISHTNIVKNQVGEIIGFCYGYTEKIEPIWEREFSYHFKEGMLKAPFLEQNKDTTFLTICGAFFIQKYMQNSKHAMHLLTSLFSHYFSTIDDSLVNSIGIFEAKNNSASRRLFEKMGASALDLQTHLPDSYREERNGIILDKNYDILVHPGVVRDYRDKKIDYFGKS